MLKNKNKKNNLFQASELSFSDRRSSEAEKTFLIVDPDQVVQNSQADKKDLIRKRICSFSLKRTSVRK